MVAVRWSASVVVSGKLLELYRGVLAAELLDIQEWVETLPLLFLSPTLRYFYIPLLCVGLREGGPISWLDSSDNEQILNIFWATKDNLLCSVINFDNSQA